MRIETYESILTSVGKSPEGISELILLMSAETIEEGMQDKHNASIAEAVWNKQHFLNIKRNHGLMS